MKGAVVVGTEAASDAAASSGGGSGSGGDSGGSGDAGSFGGSDGSGSGSDADGLSFEDTLTVGAAGVLMAGLLGLPVSEMRDRKKER